MSDTTPSLREFLACYFHQDWREEAPTATEVLEVYLNEWPIEEIPKALSELNILLAQSDDELVRCVMGMGCFYNPAADGLSYREWLNGVEDRLNGFLREQSSS